MPIPVQFYLDTTYTAPTGTVHTVNSGGNLQAAIDAAQPGDVVEIQAGEKFFLFIYYFLLFLINLSLFFFLKHKTGASFTGTFHLRNKGSSTNWIHIRSSRYAEL